MLTRDMRYAIDVESPERLDPDPVREFVPYDAYRDRTASLDEFVDLTSISYRLAQQLLFSTPRDQLSEVHLRDIDLNKLTFSPGEMVLGKPKLSAAWLNYADYAEQEGIKPEEVEILAGRGDLGPVNQHPTKKVPVILWPPKDRRPKTFEAIEPGNRRYEITAKVDTVTFFSTLR
jgi:hypothetical protein